MTRQTGGKREKVPPAANHGRGAAARAEQPAPSAPEPPLPPRTTAATCLLLAIVTLLLYAPVAGHRFIDYDDPDYVFDNPHVATGLSPANIVWAFRTGHAANWHPVTWLSHELDCQLFGLRPGPQHLVNALLHSASTALLFLALARMTGRPWRAAFIAGLFGWHPLHVESVAWIAERKDVLSAFFGLLAVLAYHAWCRRKTRWRYVLVALWFALGLMAKPMLVTLPCVLLLLDFWPLRRMETAGQFWNRLREKIPLFALSAATCVVTFVVQRQAGAVVSVESIPLLPRLGNASLACLRYLGKMFWPQNLMLPYMSGRDFGAGIALISVVALVVLTALAVRLGGRFRYLPVGWFWYLGTLVPVIGLVQVGIQSMADRYTYLPSVGVFIVVAWGAADALPLLGVPRMAVAALGGAVLCACLVLSQQQLGFWRNGETLFVHAITVEPYNLEAMDCLAWTYATDPDPKLRNADRAVRLAEACVKDTERMDADYLMTLSAAYAEAGQFTLAVQTAEEALNLPYVRNAPEFAARARERIELYRAGRTVGSIPPGPVVSQPK